MSASDITITSEEWIVFGINIFCCTITLVTLIYLTLTEYRRARDLWQVNRFTLLVFALGLMCTIHFLMVALTAVCPITGSAVGNNVILLLNRISFLGMALILASLMHVRTPKELLPAKLARPLDFLLRGAILLGFASVIILIVFFGMAASTTGFQLCPPPIIQESAAPFIIGLFGASVILIDAAYLFYFVKFIQNTKSMVGQTRAVMVSQIIARYGVIISVATMLLLVAYFISRGDASEGWRLILTGGVVRILTLVIFVLWAALKIRLEHSRSRTLSMPTIKGVVSASSHHANMSVMITSTIKPETQQTQSTNVAP